VKHSAFVQTAGSPLSRFRLFELADTSISFKMNPVSSPPASPVQDHAYADGKVSIELSCFQHNARNNLSLTQRGPQHLTPGRRTCTGFVCPAHFPFPVPAL
jgi:hypothetical protein